MRRSDVPPLCLSRVGCYCSFVTIRVRPNGVVDDLFGGGGDSDGWEVGAPRIRRRRSDRSGLIHIGPGRGPALTVAAAPNVTTTELVPVAGFTSFHMDTLS